jgi:serine/threonine protein phosphatase PrpC
MRISRDEIQTTPGGNQHFQIGASTHVGLVRSNNEDNYRIVPALNLFVLSDGMGGQANGEVASAIAVETIVAQCMQSSIRSPNSGTSNNPGSTVSEKTSDLVRAVNLANRAICEASLQDPQFQGMGATVVAASVDGHRLSLIHVGDSRAYLLRAGGLKSLTADHTLVAEQVRTGLLTPEQAQTNPLRRMLIRALGASEEVEVDFQEHELQDGDVLLFCTDGLTGMVPESEIADILLHEHDAQNAADQLVADANERGGEDNVTIIVVRVVGDS